MRPNGRFAKVFELIPPVISQPGVEDVMNVKHTIAASLATILMIQAAGLAQTQTAPEPATAEAIVAIPRAHAMRVLLDHLAVDTDVRLQLAGGAIVEGRFLSVSSDSAVLTRGGLRQVVPLADIVAVLSAGSKGVGMSDGKAFGIGAAVGAGVLVGLTMLGIFSK
jgi:hypothetical protein